MKIAFVSASVSRSAGGIFDVMRRQAQELAGIDEVRVRVFGTTDANTEVDRQAWAPVTPEAFPARGPRALAFAPDMPRALAEWRPDIAHLHSLWQYPSTVVARWARKTRRPHVISPHGMLDPWALRHSGWKKALALALFERANLRSARCLHALNAAEAAAFRAMGLTNPVAIIPNGVDLPAPGATTLAPAEPEPWRHGRKMLLFLGRLHPKKGLPELLRAWSKLRADGAGAAWVLAIAGWDQGGHQAALLRLAREIGLSADETRGAPAPDVVFLGPRFGVEKDQLFRQADAFILPSMSEGLPMAVLEAWSYGKPVLMTEMCNLPEGFTAGAACRVEPDAHGLGEALRTFFTLGDRERGSVGANGRRLVEANYSWPRVAAQMRALYLWILGGGSPPSSVGLT